MREHCYSYMSVHGLRTYPERQIILLFAASRDQNVVNGLKFKNHSVDFLVQKTWMGEPMFGWLMKVELLMKYSKLSDLLTTDLTTDKVNNRNSWTKVPYFLIGVEDNDRIQEDSYLDVPKYT